MQKIEIKPLSVNECWKGRRFKTKKYEAFEKNSILILKPIDIGLAPYSLTIVFGFSNKASDIDNCLKPFIDVLQKRYLFNDRDIYELNVKKIIVKKGFEFIEFDIKTI